ncbi:MAG: hypothetical protein WAK93_03615 [Solirubrobacteraceae bacterium]
MIVTRLWLLERERVVIAAAQGPETLPRLGVLITHHAQRVKNSLMVIPRLGSELIEHPINGGKFVAARSHVVLEPARDFDGLMGARARRTKIRARCSHALPLDAKLTSRLSHPTHPDPFRQPSLSSGQREAWSASMTDRRGDLRTTFG